jgi:crotonobetainyl-CoA:carnitine CoA-transferase CaiB-like acyl-CoA transferase
MTTKYLSEYGATVLRVESAKRPETLRRAGPFAGGGSGINRSGYFANYNANKFGLSIDMSHPSAPELILRIARWADVVTENFTPGTLERWGLGYAQLSEANPSIILFSASMLGRGGPMQTQPGFGAVLSSLAGYTNIIGWPDRGPVNPYGAYTDFVCPKFAVAAILAAVDRQRRTGTGTHLDMSQLETSLHFGGPMLLDCAVNGREPELVGNRHNAASPHGAYPCAPDANGESDRWIALAVFTDAQWTALRDVMLADGFTDAASGEFRTFRVRKAHEDKLEGIIANWTEPQDRHTLMRRLQAVGVPAGVVNDTRDLFNDAQLQHRNHFTWLDHPEMGPYATDYSEVQLSSTPGRLDRPAPLLGQDTQHALLNIVGLSEAEYGALEADGVLE